MKVGRKVKNNKTKLSYPKDIDSAKEVCKKLCKEHGLAITFDDKWKNFDRTYNQCALSGDSVECAYFNNWNYDLLVFAVMHELGHATWNKNAAGRKEQKLEIFPFYTEKKNGFAREFEAWEYAIELFNATFKRNISVKQARYMMNCLNSYIPDYNTYRCTKQGISETETSFWCPMKQRVLR